FINAMDDDLNISEAMASTFKAVRRVNALIQKKDIDPDGAVKILDAFRSIDTVLNIFDFEDESYDPEVQEMIHERERARKEKKWDLADKIRDQLLSKGIVLQDDRVKPEGN
ncbi:MAG: cysteine--tRNA ligase, partial [Deltaproteobacteria bacterium]|nr:cysteine--tRNA ligase [Deltaproteobacteria bacterium]